MTSSSMKALALALACMCAPTVFAQPTTTGGCARCVGIYDMATGKVFQTCRGGYTSGGHECVILDDQCRTVGTCSP